MECFDHYPHGDVDEERAALIADICAWLGVPPALMQTVPPIPSSAAGRFVKFGDAMICTVCQLDARYCKGHAPPDAQSNDAARADSSLARRIKDCQGR